MRRSSSVSLAVVFLLVAVLFVPVAFGQPVTHGTLTGTVQNTHYDSPFPNAYVIADNGAGHRVATTTDNDGQYLLELPPGIYDLRIIYLDLTLANDSDIAVGLNTTTTHDIFISFSVVEEIILEGTVSSDGARTGNLAVDVVVEGTSYRNSTFTDSAGHYVISAPAGRFNISVYDGGELLQYGLYGPFLTPGTQLQDIVLEASLNEFSLGSFADFLINNWLYLVILIVVCIVLLIVYFIISLRLQKFGERETHRYSQEAMKILFFTVRVLYGLISLYIILTMIGYFWTQYSNTTVSYLSMWSNAIIIIFILILIARISLLFLMNFMDKVKSRKAGVTEGIPLPAISLLQIVFKYSIIVIFGFLIAVVLLSALGLYDVIASGVTSFLNANSGSIMIVVIVAIAGYLAMRFINTFLQDMKGRGSKYSPQMIKIIGTGVRFGVMFMFGLIIIFTVLSMAGMQEMGTLIVVLSTTMLGMIVAMAATGSIGNILSGLVLQSTKPYDKGHRVKVTGDLIGDVEEISLLFTRLRTLNNELVEIPNNQIMSSEIMNYTRSEVVAIEVRVSIGYDIPAKLVHELLENGAKATKDILKDPKPFSLTVNFGDNAIEYLLRAYTNKTKLLPSVRSRLLYNVQENFYDAGVEILTPWQLVKREDIIPDPKQVTERYEKMKRHKDSQRKEDEEAASEGMKMFDGVG
jgi:small-conductance mechanosensitive channel